MAFRLIPPVAVPAGRMGVLRHLMRAGPDSCRELAEAIARSTDASHVSLHGSGKAALASVLRDVVRGRAGDVLVPAYTCWSVPAAVVSAGLRVRTVDVDPDSLDFDQASLDRVNSEGLVAVVGAHLFARSCDMQRVVDRFGGNVAVIEDAAQAWPERINTGAHATVLSFARGKPLPLGGGGAILRRGTSIPSASTTRPGGWIRAAELVATDIMARPLWYRIPSAIPWLGIGTTEYDPGFDRTRKFHDWQGALGTDLLASLGELSQARSRAAARIGQAASSCQGWRLPAPALGEGPIRCPVLAPSRLERDRVIKELRRLGVSASPMYPGTILDIPAIAPHLANPAERAPGARTLADRLLTLPVYPGLREQDLQRICSAFVEAANARASA